jgi:hypothetical protein
VATRRCIGIFPIRALGDNRARINLRQFHFAVSQRTKEHQPRCVFATISAALELKLVPTIRPELRQETCGVKREDSSKVLLLVTVPADGTMSGVMFHKVAPSPPDGLPDR